MNGFSSLWRLAVALISVALPLAADSLSLTFIVQGRPQQESVEVQLRAVRVDGSGSPIHRIIRVPGTEAFDLAPGNWQVSIESPRFWSAPAVVTTGRLATLELWPAGTLRGKAQASGKGEAVHDLRIAFAPPAADLESALPTGESVCSLKEEQWHCPLPAGTYDIRLLSRGFAAEFRWNQEVREQKETDLGAFVLRRGASLIGLVSAARGVELEMKDVVIVAKQRLHSISTPRQYTTSANGRGFFQIAGLPAGEYLVHAKANGLRSEERPTTILEDRNAELRSPLVLDTPRTFSLTVLSAASSEDKLWQLTLYKRVDHGLAEANRGVASADGRWRTEIVPGNYVLHVGRADGSLWKSANVVVDASDVHLDLSIPVVQVVGTVTVGDRRLADARLIIGGRYQRSGKLKLVTDREGAFSGELPANENDEKKWKITIEADVPRVQRTVDHEPSVGTDGKLRFEIDLPSTTLEGRVLQEDGTAASDAWVTLTSNDGDGFEQAATNSDGTFEFVGFEPGAYRIQANRFEQSSDVVAIQVSQDDLAPVELVLRKDVIVRGRVRSRGAIGVAARMLPLPRDTRTNVGSITTTDAQGQFELRLPPRTRIFDIVVDSPGFALATGRIEIQDGKLLTLTLDQAGGRLALEIPTEGNALIRHDGSELPVRWLTEWAGGAIEPGGDWIVAKLANVEPGEYSVCVAGRCKSGILTPHGNLVLSLRGGG